MSMPPAAQPHRTVIQYGESSSWTSQAKQSRKIWSAPCIVERSCWILCLYSQMSEYSKPEFIHNNTSLHLLSFCGDPGTVLATLLVQVNLIFTRMKYFFVIFTDKKNETQRDYIMIHPKAPHCIRIQTQAAGYQNWSLQPCTLVRMHLNPVDKKPMS